MKSLRKRLLTFLLAAALPLSLAGCDEGYEPADVEVSHIDTNYEGPNISDYVNEGIEDAKENGLYKESDYSDVLGGPSPETSETDQTEQTEETPNNYPETSGGQPGQTEDLLSSLANQAYNGEPFVYVNDNKPGFTEEDLKETEVFEFYSELDELGRTGYAFASLNASLMPAKDEERGDISSIKPTGWVQAKYEGIGNGGWLYNRCHLIAWALAGENANERNLLTGTRYFNTEGMLPFETQVMRYVDEHPDNHVLYRVTPVYDENDLLAKGVLLEAYSIEDEGILSFCVYLFNVQPGIDICYQTGESRKTG